MILNMIRRLFDRISSYEPAHPQELEEHPHIRIVTQYGDAVSQTRYVSSDGKHWNFTPGAFVYIFADGGRTLKVGVSTMPLQRVVAIRRQTGRHLMEVVLMLRSDRAWEIENRAHKALSGHRTKGEWFAVPVDEARRILVDIAGSVERSKAAA